MKRPALGPLYLKLRTVRPRFLGPGTTTYEAKIIGRREAGIWDTHGTSRGHATMDAARAAGLALADRRGWKLVDDPRRALLRAAEFKARYGDDV